MQRHSGVISTRFSGKHMRPLAFACLCLSFSFVAPAQQTSTKPAEASSAMADSHSKPPAQDAYVVDLIQNSVRFEASGLGQRDLIFSAHINSESAVRELGLLVYPFASSFESLEIVYARVRKPDGTIVNTPESDVQELDSAVSREAPMYTDQREKHIAIKSLSAGDVLELHVRWMIHEAIAPGHFWYTHNFFRSGICRKEVLEFNLPRASAVTFNHTDVQPVIREENDRRIYSFETSNLKRSEESKVPAWEANFGGAKPPDVQLSSFTSWEEVGAWFAALAQPKAAVTPEIRSRADSRRHAHSNHSQSHAQLQYLLERLQSHLDANPRGCRHACRFPGLGHAAMSYS